MVTLTRLTGGPFALNADLIERVDQTPDTVITLVDGTKYLVRESLDEVVAAVRHFRSSVLAAAADLEVGHHRPAADAAPASVLQFPHGER
ncbi:MAG: flagellar FlbD family protein [Nocardioidaceae bacterium]|nr:flagellar FlbD family protein [Nocardioidaceae bacterium]